jgi:predicted RNase H-like HicB family nuclease
MKHKYTVVYERSETGWAAFVADVPGLGVAARTRKHVSTLIREGIKFHLEGLRENEIKARS